MKGLPFRLLLLLYPRSFRRRFGGEMLALAGWQMDRRGRTVLQAWLHLLRDTLKHAPRTHAAVWKERLGRGTVPPRVPEASESPRLGPGSGSLGPGPRRPLESVFHDLRFATRGLLRRPGFAGVALLTLALGIGANTAVFSLLHTILFDPLPFRNAEELVYVHGNPQSREPSEGAETYPDVRDWPGIEAAFTGISPYAGPQDVTFQDRERPERVRGAWVSSDFTRVMGTEPVLGRGFQAENEIVGSASVVLVGEAFWRNRLGSDPEIVGKTIDIGQAQRTVVGVMPEAFRFPDGTQIWFPAQAHSPLPTLLRHFEAVARLAPGVSVQESGPLLRESLQRVGGPVEPDAMGTVSLREWIFGSEKEPVLIFYAVVSLVLLVACVNVANLFLARNETRRQELAVRASLGAGRRRIMGEALAETLLLTGAGGALGAALGWFGRDLILAFLPEDLPPYFTFDLQPGVLLFFAGIIAASGLLFGAIPAVSAGRVDVRRALASGSRLHTGGRSRRHLWTSLVVVEVTLALALLVSANLVGKSAVLQGTAEVGFDSRGIVTADLSPPFSGEQVWAFYEELTRRVAALPGFSGASLAWNLPTGVNIGWWAAYIEGWEGPGGEVQDVHYQRCGPDYFTTLGIPILEGREFRWSDDFDAPRVVAVNQAFAERYWPGESPVGKRLGRGGPPASEDGWFQVVALVGSNHNEGYGRPATPQVYLPFHQSGLDDLTVLARSDLDEATALRTLRETVAAINPTVPVTALRTLDRAVAQANWQIPFSAWAFGLLSLIALVLAATGVYGLVAFSVRQRSRELAIRVALGAEGRDLEGMVLRESLRSLGFGVLGGLLLASAGVRLLTALLFGVGPLDPVVYAGSAGIMTAVVLLASYLPARDILRLDPVAVLGKE